MVQVHTKDQSRSVVSNFRPPMNCSLLWPSVSRGLPGKNTEWLLSRDLPSSELNPKLLQPELAGRVGFTTGTAPWEAPGR